MTTHAAKWQSANGWRPAASPLAIEAGLTIGALGAAGAIVALGALPLTWRGLMIAALSYGVVAYLIGIGLSRHAPHRHFGLANSITLVRATFDVMLLAIVAEEVLGSGQVLDTTFRAGLTVAAAIALMLDGADGWAARRTRMTSEFGVRFDMEADGVFLLAMALALTVGGIVGPWVLVSGLTYYSFRIAGRIWPVLAAPLFPSWRRKVICVAQGAFLIAAIAPAMPQWGARLCCLAGLALLLYSFAVDIAWLLGQKRDASGL